MTPILFQTATPEFAESFTRAPARARHGLSETGLFSDSALAGLLDRHPSNLVDIHAPQGETRDSRDFPVTEVEAASGRALLDLVRDGRIWINLRRAMNESEAYRPVFDAMIAALRAASPRFRPRRCTAGILISSPTARVPYHCDKTDVVLWHVRGRKRLILYPPVAPYLEPEDYETRIIDLSNDDLPWDPAFEAGATAFDLQPGDLASWPLHSPHRVENLEGLNVSVTMEFSSLRSATVNGAYIANGVLRRRFGLSPMNPQEAPAALNAAKLVLSRAFQALNLTAAPESRAA